MWVLSLEGSGKALIVPVQCQLGFATPSAFLIMTISGRISSLQTASVATVLGRISENGSFVPAEWEVQGESASGMVFDGIETSS